MTDRLLTQREVCQRLGICPKTLQNMRRRRQIDYLRLGHHTIRFKESAVQRLLKQAEVAVSRPNFS